MADSVAVTSPAQSDAALVREAREAAEKWRAGINVEGIGDLLVRLTAAAERADEAEKALEELRPIAQRCLRAEATLLAAQQERDEHERLKLNALEGMGEVNRRAERAEATLEQIAEHHHVAGESTRDSYEEVKALARATLTQDAEAQE